MVGLGNSRERYPTDVALAAEAGMTVAVESGKRKVTIFRRAREKRLRDLW